MLRVFQKTQRARVWRPSAAQTRTGLGVLAGLTGVALVAALAAMHTERKRVDDEVRAALVGSETNVASLVKTMEVLEAKADAEYDVSVALRAQFERAIADIIAGHGGVEECVLRAVNAIAPSIDPADTRDGIIEGLGRYTDQLQQTRDELTRLLLTVSDISTDQSAMKRGMQQISGELESLKGAAKAHPAAVDIAGRLEAIELRVEGLQTLLGESGDNADLLQDVARMNDATQVNVHNVLKKTVVLLDSAMVQKVESVLGENEGRMCAIESNIERVLEALEHSHPDVDGRIISAVQNEVNTASLELRSSIQRIDEAVKARLLAIEGESDVQASKVSAIKALLVRDEGTIRSDLIVLTANVQLLLAKAEPDPAHPVGSFGAGRGRSKSVDADDAYAVLAHAVPFLRPSTQLEILKLLLLRKSKPKRYV